MPDAELLARPGSEPVVRAAGWVAADDSARPGSEPLVRRASGTSAIAGVLDGAPDGIAVQRAHSASVLQQLGGGGSSTGHGQARGSSRMGGSSYASRMELLGGIGMAPGSRGAGGSSGRAGTVAGGTGDSSWRGGASGGSSGSHHHMPSGRDSDAGSHSVTATISTIGPNAAAGLDADSSLHAVLEGDPSLRAGKVLTVLQPERERLRAASVGEYNGNDGVVEAEATPPHHNVLPGMVSCGNPAGLVNHNAHTQSQPHTVHTLAPRHTPTPPACDRPKDDTDADESSGGGSPKYSGRRRSTVILEASAAVSDISDLRMASAPLLRYQSGAGCGGGAVPVLSDRSLEVVTAGSAAGERDWEPQRPVAQQLRAFAEQRQLSPFAVAASTTTVHVSPSSAAQGDILVSPKGREEGRTMRQASAVMLQQAAPASVGVRGRAVQLAPAVGALPRVV